MGRSTIACVMGAALTAAACAPQVQRHTGTPAAPEGRSDYSEPPELKAAVRAEGDAVTLSGAGLPEAVIRLTAADGQATTTRTSKAGDWSVTVPGAAEPRLYSLSEDPAGRRLRARGYIATLPSPGAPAAILRPGAGADSFASDRGPINITALDFDHSGVGVASGRAPVGEVVHVSLDGADAGEDRAGPDGVFTVALSESLHPGPHLLTATGPSGRASAAFQADPSPTLAGPGFVSARARDAWRIDWMTPGGGVQTTIVFDPAGAGA